VLYLTSHADRLFEAKQQLWAEEAYLDKPFTREGLREAIALLLFGRTTL
jgi:two-component SAPR family response regulator